MLRVLGAIVVGVVIIVAPASAADADATAPADLCLTLAQAKHDQWSQHKVLIEQTRTFSDGTTKNTTILVSEDTAFMQRRGVWRARAVGMRDRNVPPAEVILKGMGLGTCTKSGEVQEANQAATLYSYDYLPDKNGFVAHGKMWISDSTGLPLREEMQDPAPPANAMIARAISAKYTYNEDVQIPRGAELANANRLFYAMRGVSGMQGGFEAGAGAQ